MRRAIWVALAFMGTAPLVVLAQQNAGGQGAEPALAPPAASPSGTSSVQRGQDTGGMDVPGAPGQQSAGSLGTATGEPATGGSGTVGTQGGTVTQDTGNPVGLDSVPLQRTGPQGDQGLTGSGTGTGGGGAAGAGPTYQGTSQEEPPSATPPVDVGTQVGPAPNERSGGTGRVGTGTGTGGGSAARAPVPRDPEAMRRELISLRQRVSRLESELDALRGTGGGGTAGTGDTGTPDTSNVEVKGPVTLAITTFDGRVVDVSRRHIDIVDTSDGSFYRLSLNDRTKAFVGPRLDRIPVQQLSEGAMVRTSFALISTGDQQALNIVAQPQRPPQQQGPQQRR